MSLFPISFKAVVPYPLEGLISDESCWGQNLTLTSGKRYILTASSGRGKSTFIAYLNGLRCDYRGEIYFDQQAAQSIAPSTWNKMRSHEIATVYQDLRLFPQLTALENITLSSQLSPLEPIETIVHLAETLGIKDNLKSPCGLLSFGQQQRVALIRSLVRPFQLLLLDEPVSHLDEDNRKIVWSLVDEYIQKRNATLVATSLGENYMGHWDEQIKV